MGSLKRKAVEMRNAIDMIEGAMMGAGELIDIPAKFEGARDDLLLMPKITLGQLRRIRRELSECTRIINSDEFADLTKDDDLDNSANDTVGKKMFNLITKECPGVATLDPDAIATVMVALATSAAGVLSGVTVMLGEGVARGVAKNFGERITREVHAITGKVIDILKADNQVN